MDSYKVLILSPALAAANNGNWHTAARWERFLAAVADVRIALDWSEEPVDAVIALHARRSAPSIARFHRLYPDRPLAVVLTGTDLYGDIEQGDEEARHSLEYASHLVVLQSEGLHRLPTPWHSKTRVIVQSARSAISTEKHVDFAVIGHLRPEKDPRTLFEAVRLLGPDKHPQIVHIGNALDTALGDAARSTMRECPGYRWLGGLEADATRAWLSHSRALIHMSRIEGGANVVIEAVCSGVPVLASRIDGNIGLLGRDYAGYFPVGDARALAVLMERYLEDRQFAELLAAQCRALEPAFAPEVELGAVRALWADMSATIRR